MSKGLFKTITFSMARRQKLVQVFANAETESFGIFLCVSELKNLLRA